jgi:ubiquinone/menaquinone biosynthesis C-methylase UbiE
MDNASAELDYVLGTHDDELNRLGLQHRVWRPRALEAWRRAGFTVGQTILDAGCGPGYASLDLAGIVGPAGRVVAVDRSARFLDALRRSAAREQIAHVTTHLADLDVDELPDVQVDGAWVRWVFAFVRDPRALLRRVVARLRPGGRLVIHEYFDYTTWRFLQRSPIFEDFVAQVMKSWRESGGEPEIGRELPGWLEDLGLTITSLNPIVEIVGPESFVWQWPKTFVEVGVQRLTDLGEITGSRAEEIRREFAARESAPDARIVTPAVLEIIARK